MDLATTLALIILVGAIGLAVVTVLAFVIYRNCTQQNVRTTLPPHAPALNVPPPTVPSPAADGAPASVDAEPPRVPPEKSRPAEEPEQQGTSPHTDPHFLEYDGTTFRPFTPSSWKTTGNGSIAARTSANGFAWR